MKKVNKLKVCRCFAKNNPRVIKMVKFMKAKKPGEIRTKLIDQRLRLAEKKLSFSPEVVALKRSWRSEPQGTE